MKPKILHIGAISGVPQTLSLFQTKIGYISNTLSFYTPDYGLVADRVIEKNQ